ncbi:MAG: hypothetical protein GY723_04445 [bacterium]|nr:hypothetical protein [bacterium]MCP5067342.1 hypothetical protein [bacterium]
MPDLPPTSPVRPEPIDAVARVAEEPTPRAQERPQQAQPERGVQVEISLAARESLARAEVATRTLDSIEEELSLGEKSLEAAGREAFLESIREPSDPSTSAIADRIFTGIIGYVYDAFQLEEPNPSRAQLEEFAGAASRGLDRGLHDAASLLMAFGARREVVAAERAETFETVRNAVAHFAEEQMRPDRPEPSEPTERNTPDLFGGGSDSE